MSKFGILKSGTRAIRHALLLVLSFSLYSVSVGAAEYVGSDSCQDCHQGEYSQWLGSDHQLSMQLANTESVLGNFANNIVNFHDIESRFYQDGNKFLVDTIGDDGAPHSYEIKYTFGHYPLQQYLIELDNGHVQALNTAWDSRPETEGGQRWFHLQEDEDITPEHPFFWSNHFQNWNSRCADCHSTNLQKNYDVANHSYATEYSEINVACEACHGPARSHIELLNAGADLGDLSGFENDLAATNNFVFNEGNPIASNSNAANRSQVNSCASCHSRRGIVGGYEANQDYHQQFSLSTLNQGLYFADGQIDDEVFVFASFLQSKMYAAGVSCSNCHNVHSTELKADTASLCQQCHQATSYQTTAHHQHAEQSSGAQCVNCHMPERVYMGVDARRDHSFSIPRPALASRANAPDACSNCHVDWEEDSSSEKYRELFGEEIELPWAEANLHAHQLNTLALRDILAIADDPQMPGIIRSTLLSQSSAFPARITVESIQKNLPDNDPLVRRAAVEASSILPANGRLALLEPLLEDPVKSVRMAVANQLADAFQIATADQQPSLLLLFNEYEESLLLNEDSPGVQLNLASFYYRRGDRIRVERAYQRALEIEPAFVPVLLNLADLRREQGNENEAEVLLKQALLIANDSGAVHHALGLLYVRTGNMSAAVDELALATQQLDASPRFSYILAVALDNVGRRNEAIDTLLNSEQRWPNQVDSLLLLVSLLDQENRGNELLPLLSNLSRILPGNPDVAALVRKYVRQ